VRGQVELWGGSTCNLGKRGWDSGGNKHTTTGD